MDALPNSSKIYLGNIHSSGTIGTAEFKEFTLAFFFLVSIFSSVLLLVDFRKLGALKNCLFLWNSLVLVGILPLNIFMAMSWEKTPVNLTLRSNCEVHLFCEEADWKGNV